MVSISSPTDVSPKGPSGDLGDLDFKDKSHGKFLILVVF